MDSQIKCKVSRAIQDSIIKLTNELRETEDKLGYTSSDHWRAHEVETKYLQEVPTKDNCRIM